MPLKTLIWQTQSYILETITLRYFKITINTPIRWEEEEEIKQIDDNSELELLSNLSSSTEIEEETKEHNLRRSKGLTKTNPIFRRLNNPVLSDYRKYSQKTKRPGNDTGHRRQQLTTSTERACPEEIYNNGTILMDTARNTAPKE